jgi:hypothetical protein
MKLTPKAQKSLNKVIARFRSGDLGPVVEVALLKRKGAPVPFDKWSFGNKVMAYLQSGGSTDLRGYNQWREAGRQVKKDSYASFILVPRVIKKEKDNGEEEARLVGFIAGAVFPYHMTEGESLLEHDYAPAEPPPLMEVAGRLGVEVTWKLLPPDRRGDCNLKGTHINLGTHDPRTWFHELAHAAHARANSKLEKGGAAEARQEIVAEFTACVLAELYGYDYTGNAWQYISALHKDPLTAVVKAMAEVEKVLDIIFENGKEQTP